MTRKQYKRRMMEMYRKLKRYNPDFKYTDRVGRPQFGTILSTGSHAGEKIVSYKQVWGIINELYGGII